MSDQADRDVTSNPCVREAVGGLQKPAGCQSCSTAVDLEESPSPTIQTTQSTRYTTFTLPQRRLLTLLIGFSTITSPLTATIYFPLLPLLRTHFHTSAQAINLSLTIYIVFQAISPLFAGPYSDSLGRRPVYVVTLVIYCAANIGLALNRSSLAALLVLRALQSLGASAAYAVSYGVVADVCVRADRGRMLGPVNMALNLGTCIGPVVGGWVAYKSKSYEWCFWALVILGILLLVSIIIFLPETARSLVGNGTGRAMRVRYQSLWTISRHSFSDDKVAGAEHTRASGEPTCSSHHSGNPQAIRSNPLKCLRILTYPDAALSLWMHGSFYVVDYALVAAAPDIYGGIYQFNELQIGLTYLTRGLGIITGSYLNGKFMDYNYRFVAKRLGWREEALSRDDLEDFPIERARSRGSLWLLAVSTAALVGFGWSVSKHVHVAVPLVLQFVIGAVETTFYTIYSTLLVDTFPAYPSTAAAAASVVRCTMAAAGVAALQPMLEKLGRGWYFTLLGLWSGSFGVGAILLIRYKGMGWRKKRTDRDNSS